MVVCPRAAQCVQRKCIPRHESNETGLMKRIVQQKERLTIARHTTVNTPKSEK